MSVLEQVAATLPTDAVVHEVWVGFHWTVVVVARGERLSAGMASTGDRSQHVHGFPSVREAGRLNERPALELARLAHSDLAHERAVGLATINALIEVDLAHCVELNAREYMLEHGRGRRVALVGHFPFVEKLRRAAGRLWVLELYPQPGDLPAEAAPEVLPLADLIGLTATTLLNGTFEALMQHAPSSARVIMLGPSTPMTPVMFAWGLDVLAGSYVDNLEALRRTVLQGATFKQVRGVRRLTMARN